MTPSFRQLGFSLLELSVVLIILALLAGGIMVGQDMIRQSKVKSVLSDLKKYETAYNAFVGKYNAMPGDMPDATDYWGTAPDCANGNPSTGTGTETCNGNGNAWISDPPGTVPASSFREQFFAWQHLSNAKLVKGRFTGIEAAAPRLAVPGVNIPDAAIEGTGFTYMSNMSDGTGSWWAGAFYAMLSFGKTSTPGNIETGGMVLTAAEAWGMDYKIDDGKPGTGLFKSRRGLASCATTNDPLTAEYNLSSTGPQCSFLYSLEHDPGLTP